MRVGVLKNSNRAQLTGQELVANATPDQLDAATNQGGAVADDVDDIDSDATLTIDDIIEDAEGQGDEDQSADVG